MVKHVEERDLRRLLAQHHQHGVHQLNGFREEVPPQHVRHLPFHNVMKKSAQRDANTARWL